MNKKLLLSCGILFFSSQAHAMRYCTDVLSALSSYCADANYFSHEMTLVPAQPKKNEIQVIAMPAALCAIVEQHIFTIPSLCSAYPCLRDAAVTVNALAQTNRFLNKVINDDDKTLALIKQLSQQFDCPNIGVARALCTKAANSRYALQRAFLVGWEHNWDSIKDDVNKLKHMGLDLNFSYRKDRPTALIQTIAWNDGGHSNVAQWLIENGADITVCTPEGKNAFMIALATFNERVIDALIDHPMFAVNHEDNDKNTPLHRCFIGAYGNGYMGPEIEKIKLLFVCETTKKLLKKGVNPTVINKDGHTPLDLAKKLRYQPIIDLLEKAITEFNFKKNNIQVL